MIRSNTITLSRATIAEIRNYAYEYDIDQSHISETGVEFMQNDDCISVDFEFYGRFIEEYMEHSEVAPPNLEDMSHWTLDTVNITGIAAWDSDGNSLTISNEKDINL